METTTHTQSAGPAQALDLAHCSAHHTPAPWTWEHHPQREGVMALTAGQADVILVTGDHECAWAEIRPADRVLIAHAPDLLAAVEDLMQIVEGVRNERWGADGRRLKDTPEWCRLYSLRCAIIRGSPNVKDEPRHSMARRVRKHAA